MPKALEVRHLSVRFGRDTILEDLSFALEQGASMAILGPNGSGKTVLLNALIGLVRHEGEVAWAPGTRFGYVPQKLDLERDLPVTCGDFLKAVSRVPGIGDADPARALAWVGMEPDKLGRLVGTLSGGQFQRLLVACALIRKPDTFLFDEVSAGVDEPGQEMIYDLVHRLRAERGATLLFISHELSMIDRFADTLLCLSRDGAWFGPPREILTPERLAKMYGPRSRYHAHGPDAH